MENSFQNELNYSGINVFLEKTAEFFEVSIKYISMNEKEENRPESEQKIKSICVHTVAESYIINYACLKIDTKMS